MTKKEEMSRVLEIFRNVVTVQLSEEHRRRAGLNLPYSLVGLLPTAELLRNVVFL